MFTVAQFVKEKIINNKRKTVKWVVEYILGKHFICAFIHLLLCFRKDLRWLMSWYITQPWKNMFKKLVHNKKMLMNIKKKGLDTKSCECKDKTGRYVISPLFKTCRDGRESIRILRRMLCLGGNIIGKFYSLIF